ncbi:MAG: 50S ribosomal protein L1 [Candidatus Woesearchaeota archaeon]
MQASETKKTLQEAKKQSEKRNFTQSIDLIFTLKNLDFKKPDDHVDFYATMPNSIGRETKTCALVGPELVEEATKNCDRVIRVEEFEKIDKKEIKKLAKEYHFFIAQANIMAQVAKTFGRVLGPRGKMPDPKAGCVVPPKTQLKPLIERLNQTIRVSAKKDPVIHLLAGREDQDEEEVAANIAHLYNQLLTNLPLEINNLKATYVKTTMGKPVVLQ